MYQKAYTLLSRYFSQATLFKYGFNWSPMYRRSTARIQNVSDDLMRVEASLPLSWKNSNYVGSIFGGSMLSASDPVLMIQLMQILGDDFVVWDKAVHMRFKRPARERVQIVFKFSADEIEQIRQQAVQHGEVDCEKVIELTNTEGTVFAVATKTLYIATKAHYKAKRAQKQAAANS